MSKTTNRILFKATNNKKSSLNLNEIDINLLMQNPTHIRKLIAGDDEEPEHEDNALRELRKSGGSMGDYRNFLRNAGSSLIKKYMDQNKKKGIIQKFKDKEGSKGAGWSTFDRDKFLNDVKNSTDRSSFIYTPEEIKKMRK